MTQHVSQSTLDPAQLPERGGGEEMKKTVALSLTGNDFLNIKFGKLKLCSLDLLKKDILGIMYDCVNVLKNRVSISIDSLRACSPSFMDTKEQNPSCQAHCLSKTPSTPKPGERKSIL
jgi:hypothetical protein